MNQHNPISVIAFWGNVPLNVGVGVIKYRVRLEVYIVSYKCANDEFIP